MRDKFSMISDTNNIKHTKVRVCNAQVLKVLVSVTAEFPTKREIYGKTK